MAAQCPTDETIFTEAVQFVPPDRWEAFLVDRCAGDDELLDRVRRLLAAHQDLGEFREPPSTESNPLDVEPQPTQAPSSGNTGGRIGPYKLREQIGEGGMGVVYVAEQRRPIRRKVALKLIRPGMASRDVVARFEAERQALALMDHPNIARVFDGGATDAGQPYFVMELVQGRSITDYCDENQLPTEDRLRLFGTVCRAVQHAHQKGIIHRDLKPSNIIVSEIDNTAVPKVIDFGVAKAVNQPLADETLYTQFSQMIGTPLYMSPEQTGLGVVDIDTRSDVYSLGVLLYELLTGNTPFDSETLKQAGFDEMRRIIREDEPLKPSAMVSTLNAQAASTISAQRGSQPNQLSHALVGELDWLVMRALEKDRNRRYESASALAADIERFLNQQPISAGPPSLTYRCRKYAQRNRGQLAAWLTLVAVLFVGLSIFAVGNIKRQRELRAIAATVEQHLSSAQTAIETADLSVAKSRIDQAQLALAGTRDSLVEMAAATDELQAEIASRREQLDRFEQFRTIADDALDGSGNNIEQKQQALALYGVLRDKNWAGKLQTSYLGPEKQEEVRETTYEILLSLAHYAVRREGDVEAGFDFVERALAFHEHTKALYWVRAQCFQSSGDEQNAAADQQRFEMTATGSPLDFYFPAGAAFREGDFATAIAGFEAALRVRPDHFNSLRLMAQAMHRLDRSEEAAVALRACLALKPNNQTTLRLAVRAFADAGKYEDALATNDRLRASDPDSFLPYVNERDVHEAQGDYAAARQASNSLIELISTNPRYAATRASDLAKAYDERGRLAYRWMKFPLALEDFDEAVARQPRTVQFHVHRADTLQGLGRLDEALQATERAVALYETSTEQHDAGRANLMSRRATLLAEAERCKEAVAEFQRAHELAPDDAEVLQRYAYFRATCKDSSYRDAAEAVTLARKAVELNPGDAITQFVLAVVEYQAGNDRAAISAAQESLTERVAGPERPSVHFIIAMAHRRMGDEPAAQAAYDAGLAWLESRNATTDLYGFKDE